MAENLALKCDARFITSAVGNLVQNSIDHNPRGCDISIELACADKSFLLTVKDNGVGLAPEKLRELREKPHYLDCMDERLDLKQGFGLVLVRRIAEAHNGMVGYPRRGR